MCSFIFFPLVRTLTLGKLLLSSYELYDFVSGLGKGVILLVLTEFDYIGTSTR